MRAERPRGSIPADQRNRARALGDLRSTNMVALGALTSLAEFCSQDNLLAAVARVAPAKLHDAATRAIKQGYQIAETKSGI